VRKRNFEIIPISPAYDCCTLCMRHRVEVSNAVRGISGLGIPSDFDGQSCSS
jgi:hypothetical protein